MLTSRLLFNSNPSILTNDLNQNNSFDEDNPENLETSEAGDIIIDSLNGCSSIISDTLISE
jgi:hypothetical protein